MILIIFRCGVKIGNTVEVPQYVKFTCSKSHIESFEKIGRAYGFQPELLSGEIQHFIINKSNFADLRHIRDPYLKLDV